MSECLFDTRHAERLTPKEYGARFESEWEKLSRRFFKFESHQYYAERTDGPFADFMRHDDEAFVKRLLAQQRGEEPFFVSARKRGASFVRVHAISLPPSDYVRYEVLSYALSERMGETVLVLDSTEQSMVTPEELPDFMICDDQLLFVLAFDQGQLQHVDVVVDPVEVKKWIAIGAQLQRAAQPFRQLCRPDPVLEKRLLEEWDERTEHSTPGPLA